MIQFLHASTTTGLFWCWSHRKAGICTLYTCSSSAHTSKELPLYTGSLDRTFDKKVHAFQHHPTSEKEEACKQHCSKVCLRLSHTHLHCSYHKMDCHVMMKDWTYHMIFHVHLLHLKYSSSSWLSNLARDLQLIIPSNFERKCKFTHKSRQVSPHSKSITNYFSACSGHLVLCWTTLVSFDLQIKLEI